MTNREFFVAVAANEITEDVIAHALAAIEKMEASAEKRRNTPSKKATENAEIAAKWIADGVLTTTAQTASEIGAVVEMHPSKVNAVLKTIIDQLVVGETKGKSGKVKTYALAE